MYQDAQVNPKKIYIGNLPYSATESQLSDLCAEFGEVTSVRIITDHATGRSKGFAFVEFATEEAAAKAVETLNGTEMEGRALMVTIARPQAPRENRGGFGGGGNGGGYNRDRRPFNRDNRGGDRN